MVAAFVVTMTVYYMFDPSDCEWMPKCSSKLISGYDCTGCRIQRALCAALHYRFGEAWRLNPFLCISLPFVVDVIWSSFLRLRGSATARRITHSQIATWTYITAFIAWWVLRNINSQLYM